MATMKLATSTTMSVSRIARLCMCFSSSARSMTLHTVAPKAAFVTVSGKNRQQLGFVDSRSRLRNLLRDVIEVVTDQPNESEPSMFIGSNQRY